MENLKFIIAENIKRIRESLELTQTEFAQKLNYSDKAISKWERGESIPDIIVLKQICDFADLPLDWLVTDHLQEQIILNKHKKKRAHIMITLLSVGLVWLIATLVFLILSGQKFNDCWLTFLAGGIVSEIVLIVFNSIWGIPKFNYVIVSMLLWNVLTFVFFMFFRTFPLLFFLGIPGQIIVIFWSMIKPFKKEK